MDKPVEYCLFWVQSWCLPSSEWAAWAQLGAALLGAATTVGVAWWASHAQQRQAVVSLRLLSSHLLSSLEGMRKAAAQDDYQLLGEHHTNLRNARSEIQAIPLANLDERGVGQRIELVAVCAAASSVLDDWTNHVDRFLEDTLATKVEPKLAALEPRAIAGAHKR